MNNRIEEAVTEYLSNNLSEALDIATQINYQDGSLDWTEAYDFDELCEIAAEGGKEEVSKLCRACLYGNTWGGRVRYDAYGNLEPAEKDDLLKDARDCLEDIVNELDDYIDEDGCYVTLNLSDDLARICAYANVRKCTISNIDYDIDNEDLEEYNGDKSKYIEEYELPTDMEFEIDLNDVEDSGQEVDEYLGDLISDETGYCINGFNYEMESVI